MSALRELVEAEDAGEDAGGNQVELRCCRRCTNLYAKLRLMHESELICESPRADHSLRESGKAFTTATAFWPSKSWLVKVNAAGEGGASRAVSVEIRIETDGKRVKREAEWTKLARPGE